MAHNSSGQLSPSRTYTLGEYTFRFSAQYDSYEDQTHVLCHASNGTSNAQKGKDFAGVRRVLSWKVEAEDKTADVYATFDGNYIDTNPINRPIPSAASGSAISSDLNHGYSFTTGTGLLTNVYVDARHLLHLYASASPGTVMTCTYNGHFDYTRTLSSSFTHNGKTVYYCYEIGASWTNPVTTLYPVCNGGAHLGSSISQQCAARVCWIMIYGEPEEGFSDKLIARFEIDIAEAGGGTWDDPGSTGEPSKTLHITVTGALSGRHNDPLNDTSYHYTPSDREQADVYGSGGVGGSGGAGGAGASTVIIYNCATDKAGYTEEIAIAKRHGYGSGAGKGGKGGDGCILVYY